MESTLTKTKEGLLSGSSKFSVHEQSAKDDRRRELWLQLVAGFIIFQNMRTVRLKEFTLTPA